ncbi:MAG: hypothetical protein ACK5LS_11940 [Propioniciclava sp.]
MESFDWQIAGLPLHPLFVHGAVVIIPLAALMIMLTAVWPAAARKLTFLTPAVAGVGLVLAFGAHVSGEWLFDRVGRSAALAEHIAYAELMNPAAGLLALAAGALWWWQRRLSSGPPVRPRAARIGTVATSAFGILVAVGALVAVVLTGDAGARAVWLG